MTKTIKEQINVDGFIVYDFKGISMYPLFKEGEDLVHIEKYEEPLKVYDIVLFQRPNEDNKYVLHRVMKISRNKVVVCGDNQRVSEIIFKEQIIGKVVGYYKRGRYVSIEDEEYLNYLKSLDKDISKRKVLRFAAIFSNCGFMAFPLLEALLGPEGVFYGAGYVAVFNLLVWSIGQYIMAGGNGDFKVRKAFLNPGFISVIVGILLFVASIDLPSIIGKPVEYMANLNTPVAMLIIGYTFSTLDFKEIFRVKDEIPTIIIRLIVAPLIMLGIFYTMGFRGILLTSCVVSVSAPVAATTTMFSIKYKGDEALASKLVAVSTIASIITMTLIVGFAQYIA